ncbi:transposase-like protein [Corynebacterium diphtheriae]|nr:transposase-like protein [Corynebacterium diphtheriae]
MTANSIESFNNQLRKATRNRVQFTNDDSALKTLWLMICNIEDKRAIKRAESVRLFVCGGLGLQVVRESVGVSHG